MDGSPYPNQSSIALFSVFLFMSRTRVLSVFVHFSFLISFTPSTPIL